MADAKDMYFQNCKVNARLMHGWCDRITDMKEENPLLLQRQSHFAPQNEED